MLEEKRNYLFWTKKSFQCFCKLCKPNVEATKTQILTVIVVKIMIVGLNLDKGQNAENESLCKRSDAEKSNDTQFI